MSLETDVSRILQIITDQTEAVSRTPGGQDDRLHDAQTLVFKCVQHATSTLILFRGVEIDDFGFKTHYQDLFSVLGLARMCHEAYLMFSHVFVAPPTPEEASFRFLAWRYADFRRQAKLRVRRRLAPPDAQVESWRAEIMRAARRLRPLLRANPVFARLNKRDQNDLLNRLRWPLRGWSTLGKEAGFTDLQAIQIYRYLCSYAHPGNLSVRQARLASEARELGHLATTGLKHTGILLACLAVDYVRVFPLARVVLEKDPDRRRLVDYYADFARGNY